VRPFVEGVVVKLTTNFEKYTATTWRLERGVSNVMPRPGPNL